MNTLAIWVLPALLLSGWAAAAHGQTCKFGSDRVAEFTGPIRKVVISAATGYLNIRGDAAGNVRASGRACAASENLLGKIALESRREGDVIYLTAVLPKSMFGGSKDSSLDMNVTVPRDAQLDITDTDGDLRIADVGTTSIADGDGDLNLETINGELRVNDGSGELHIVGVTGPIRVEDGAGDVTIEDARSDVQIISDRTGDMSIDKVGGSVEVLEDGAGSIVIRHVTRDVLIDRDGSGDIHVTEVGGRFSVNSDSSGDILHDHVRGDVRIPAKG